MMWSSKLKSLLTVSAVAIAVIATHAMAADQAAAPREQQKAAPPVPGKEPAKKPGEPAPAAAASPAGAVVFIDPATGKIVDPTAAQIGGLVGTPGQNVAPKAPTTFIQGPGTAVGVRLDATSFSYALATRTPDGKIVMDCVTGDQVATTRVTEGASGVSKETPKAKAPPNEK